MEMLLIYILKYWKEHLSSYGKGQLSMKNPVKAFHGSDNLIRGGTQRPISTEISTEISQYPQQ
jgi:hypothetical protein